MFPLPGGRIALPREVIDLRKEWVGDLYLTQKFCQFLTEGAPFDRHLERQIEGFRSLLLIYGPTQAVLVIPQGGPRAQGYRSPSIPTTLEACLTLPYITENIVVHGVKEPHRSPGFNPFPEFKIAFWTTEMYYENEAYFEGR
jgi:hypothetical protein